MKKFVALSALLGVCGVASAEVGLGISIRTDDPAIYVPIDIGESLRVEPFAMYSHSKTDRSDAFSSSHLTTTLWQTGAGVFAVVPLADSASAYFGGRVSYVYSKTKDRESVTGPFAVVSSQSESKQDGFELAPTLGLEYRLGKHFSIAGEAALEYRDISGDGDGYSATSTRTNLVARYRF